MSEELERQIAELEERHAKWRDEKAAMYERIAELKAEVERLRRGRFDAAIDVLTGCPAEARGYEPEELLEDFAPFWESGSADGLSPREYKLLQTISRDHECMANAVANGKREGLQEAAAMARNDDEFNGLLSGSAFALKLEAKAKEAGDDGCNA